jgi:hypothetical protein
MPNNNTQIVDIDIEEVREDDVGKDDFAFIIGPDGNLKTFVMPEHLMKDPPEEIQLILSLFGIEDIHDLENRTLH